MARSKWLEALKNLDPDFQQTGRSRVCSKHFRSDDYRSTLTAGFRDVLKKGVVPTIFHKLCRKGVQHPADEILLLVKEEPTEAGAGDNCLSVDPDSIFLSRAEPFNELIHAQTQERTGRGVMDWTFISPDRRSCCVPYCSKMKFKEARTISFHK